MLLGGVLGLSCPAELAESNRQQVWAYRHLGKGDEDATEQVPQCIEDSARHRRDLQAGSNHNGKQAIVCIVQQCQQDVQCVPPEFCCKHADQPSALQPFKDMLRRSKRAPSPRKVTC